MILKILRNEKYAGDLAQKKTFTPSYLNHEKKYNHGQEELVTIRNHHEPIVSRDIFEKAQLELRRRSPSEEQKARHTNRYCFSGKIKCGFCGKTFIPRTKKRKDGSVYRAWRCGEAAVHGKPHADKAGNHIGCDGRHIGDEDLMLIMSNVVKNLDFAKDAIINDLNGIIKSVIQADDPDTGIEKLNRKIQQIQNKKQILLDLYLGREISKTDFHSMNDKLDNDMKSIENETESISRRAELLKNEDELLKDISDTIKGLAYGELQDTAFFRNLLSKIVVHDRKTIDVYLDLLPYKFSYILSETPLPKGTGVSEDKRGKFASSVPISLANLPLIFRRPWENEMANIQG